MLGICLGREETKGREEGREPARERQAGRLRKSSQAVTAAARRHRPPCGTGAMVQAYRHRWPQTRTQPGKCYTARVIYTVARKRACGNRMQGFPLRFV